MSEGGCPAENSIKTETPLTLLQISIYWNDSEAFLFNTKRGVYDIMWLVLLYFAVFVISKLLFEL